MKKLKYIFAVVLFAAGTVFAQESTTTTTQPTYNTTTVTENHYNEEDRMVQLGADFIVPYRVDSPSGRTANLFGAHMELFLAPAWAISMQGIFGVEDKGFTDNPVYIAPGMTFYGGPGKTLEGFFRADAPILLNNDQDVGIRGGLGFLWNLGLGGLGIKYSFDATYFFDQEATSLNLVNLAAVINW